MLGFLLGALSGCMRMPWEKTKKSRIFSFSPSALLSSRSRPAFFMQGREKKEEEERGMGLGVLLFRSSLGRRKRRKKGRKAERVSLSLSSAS